MFNFKFILLLKVIVSNFLKYLDSIIVVSEIFNLVLNLEVRFNNVVSASLKYGSNINVVSALRR